MSKIADSLISQKEQLEKLLESGQKLSNELAQTKEAVLQLQGSIAALEYVQNNFDVCDKASVHPANEPTTAPLTEVL